MTGREANYVVLTRKTVLVHFMSPFYTKEQLGLMQKGKAPMGNDGMPMEWHHQTLLSKGGTNDWSNLTPMSRTEHRIGQNFGINHPK